MRIHNSIRLCTALLLALAAGPLRAQDAAPAQVTLEGEVKSARTGQPVAYASVRLPGIRRSTVADERGRFRIAGVPEGEYTLVARQVGYVEFSGPVTVDGTTPVDLQLPEDAVVLEGLTVTADRLERRARRYSGSIRTIDRAAIAATHRTDAYGMVMDQSIISTRCAEYERDIECIVTQAKSFVPAIFVDDIRVNPQLHSGLETLKSLPRTELGRVEVLDQRRRIFVYTQTFLERAAKAGYRPMPHSTY